MTRFLFVSTLVLALPLHAQRVETLRLEGAAAPLDAHPHAIATTRIDLLPTHAGGPHGTVGGGVGSFPGIAAFPGIGGRQDRGAADSCPRGAGPIALQLLGGLAGAWVGGMGPYLAIDDPHAPDREVKGDAGYQPNANTAYAIGSWAGSTLGVYGVGKALSPDCGSFGKTALGTGIVSVVLLLGRHEPYLPLFGIALAAPLQAIGGTMGFGRE